MPSAGKSARKFRSLWTLQYAVAVAEREPETGAPTKAVCLMCRAFERDETEGAKRRKRKTKVHSFSPPWRPDNMRRHLEQQHALRWAEYKDLSAEGKRRFFPADVAISTRPRTETVETTAENSEQQVSERNAAIVETAKRSRTFLVDKYIVDVLLRGVEGADAEFNGFDMHDIDWVETDEENVDENEARYAVTIDSELEMNTCVKFVANGVSFKQAAWLYQGMMGDISSLENGQCLERRVMNLCRFACAVNFQRLKDALKGGEVWAFAVVLEFCNFAGSPFIDTYVIEFTQEFQFVDLPPPEWWVLALVVTNVAGRVNGILRQLRGGKGLTHDRQHLIDLMNHLSMMTGAVGPFIPSEFLSISCEDIVIGSFSLNPVATATFLKSQGSFANSVVDSLLPNTFEALVNVTSTFVLTVLSKLSQIITETNNGITEGSTSPNSTISQVPAFLPNVLCKMRHQDFVGAMQQQRERLEKRFPGEEIERIEAQHRALRNAYLLEKRVSDELDRLPDNCSFSEGWREGIIAGVDCRALRYFCGALAAVASSSTPRSEDSEFLLINWCKIPFTQSLTDFALEAILHAQNYRPLFKH
ncbi:hypothetical protein PC110_g2691 [Phytophthora cactorum]|uniref:Uncharacterized protein n=1 Tax=Phytophthora cactorum TaxID=29920 RepID=A0A329SWV4_9STRA|nr:hypothetical protein PC110_g2691 [Phytophthora cactorum]